MIKTFWIRCSCSKRWLAKKPKPSNIHLHLKINLKMKSIKALVDEQVLQEISYLLCLYMHFLWIWCIIFCIGFLVFGIQSCFGPNLVKVVVFQSLTEDQCSLQKMKLSYFFLSRSNYICNDYWKIKYLARIFVKFFSYMIFS